MLLDGTADGLLGDAAGRHRGAEDLGGAFEADAADQAHEKLAIRDEPFTLRIQNEGRTYRARTWRAKGP